MGAVEFFRAKPACWLFGAALALLAAQAAVHTSAKPDPAQTNGLSQSVKSAQAKQGAGADNSALLAPPRPAPAYRTDLRPAFTKDVPTTLADLKSMEQHVKALAARVSPAVVAIEVDGGSGSGVVITADGLVLTAGHVCGEPDSRGRFTFPDGKTARGKTLGVHRESETGLMRITTPGPWPHAKMGDLKQTRIGDWVLALGHPGGFDLRRSLVVRLGRIIRMDLGALQTDCTISPGDSGGPLFDMHGRIIGIHDAITSSLMENYHVAVTAFYDDWDLLAQAPGRDTQPQTPRAYAGVKVVDDAGGCQLTAVDENSPAAKAGLKVGDLVLKVDGRQVPVYASFLRWVAEAEPGETLNLEIKRGDQVLSFEVKLEAPPRRP